MDEDDSSHTCVRRQSRKESSSLQKAEQLQEPTQGSTLIPLSDVVLPEVKGAFQLGTGGCWYKHELDMSRTNRVLKSWHQNQMYFVMVIASPKV